MKSRLTFQEYFERLHDKPERWGKPAAALLGALNYSLQADDARNGSKGMAKVADALEDIGGFFNKLKDVTKAFKL